jgi:hypothetical protein
MQCGDGIIAGMKVLRLLLPSVIVGLVMKGTTKRCYQNQTSHIRFNFAAARLHHWTSISERNHHYSML